MKILNNLLRLFYQLRKSFWTYPDRVFFGRESLVRSFRSFYQESIPFSHFVASITIILLMIMQINTNIYAFLSIEEDTVIEGVITGADDLGNPIQINRINPLISTNIQLEKDISELIYQSLIDVDEKGDPKPVLADFFKLEIGKRYQFKLKPDIYWSDGTPVTANDVVQTFNLVKSLESNSQLSNIYSKAANKLEVIPSQTDPLVFEFRVTEDNVIPNFYEAISFKILPAHLIGDLTPDNIALADPFINRNPVGSGPYMLSIANTDYIDLIKNPYNIENTSKINKIRFKFFTTEEKALEALSHGQIHSLAGISITSAKKLENNSNLKIMNSDVMYNQFWGLFFNLSETGPASLKNVNVRQAISSALNKNEILSTIDNFGEIAEGPIPKTSFAFSKEEKYLYNLVKAEELLEKAGYVKAEDGIRVKDNNRLSFNLTYVDNYDRAVMAENIKKQLALVGIEINLNKVSLQVSVEEYIIPRNFDLLFYGVQTLIDPDRYELFHSSQKSHPGLNISSYVSDSKRTQVVEGKTVKVPSVDDDLNDARRLVDEKTRKKKYEDFQSIIAEEVPVVFLFHPEDVYIVNKRINNISLEGNNSIEKRFSNISEWIIKAN